MATFLLYRVSAVVEIEHESRIGSNPKKISDKFPNIY